MLHAVTPWVAIFGLIFSVGMHRVEKELDAMGKGPPLPFRHYVYMYALLFYLMTMALVSTFKDIDLYRHVIDSSSAEEEVIARMRLDGEGNHIVRQWTLEASLRDEPFLRWFSALCPICVVCTFIICVMHTVRHVEAMREYSLKATWRNKGRYLQAFEMHDSTVRILALPLFYGVMSYQAVLRIWGIIINQVGGDHYGSWEERRRYLMDMYDEAFMVGDMYESYALLVFGNLIMKIVRQEAIELCDRVTDMAPAEFKNTDSLRQLSISVKRFMKETKGLTILGIKLFCFTCAAQALFKLVTLTASWYDFMPEYFSDNPRKPGMLQQSSLQRGTKYFFYGAGFVASFAAIGNIMEVEFGFHQSLLEFRPFLKFWGTKILVTIAFLQSIALAVLPPFRWWSDVRSNLFYALLVCFECMLISIMHLFAWSHSEAWYLREESYEAVSDTASEGSEPSTASPRSVESAASTEGADIPLRGCSPQKLQQGGHREMRVTVH